MANDSPQTEDVPPTQTIEAAPPQTGDDVPLDDAKLEAVNGGSELLAELGARIYQAIDKHDANAFWDSPFSPTKLK